MGELGEQVEPTESTANPESTESENGERPGRLTKVIQTVALIAAIVSPFLAYLGGREGVRATVDIQRSERQAAEDAKTREERTRIYPEFLDKANIYYLAAKEAVDAERNCQAIPKKHCNRYYFESRFLKPRAEFQGAYTNVYVYGSDEAWGVAQDLSRTLPLSADSYTSSDHQFDAVKFNSTFRRFLDVMCKELPTQPRKGCPTR